MGYSPEMFLDVLSLGLPPGSKIIDLGSQDTTIGDAGQLEQVNTFIRAYAPENVFKIKDITFPYTIEGKGIYNRAGWLYFRSDVDERPDTLYVDLSSLIFPLEFKGQFDLVVNVGTTEHLANPVGAFFLMHMLAKENGYFYHDVPMFGWGNHGLCNLTPKFWNNLTWTNRYVIVSASIRHFDETSVDRGNFYHDYMGWIRGLEGVRGISYMFRCILKKTLPYSFIPPYDAVLPQSDGSKEAKLIIGSLWPFVMTGAITREETMATVNDFLAWIGRPFRVTSFRGRE